MRKIIFIDTNGIRIGKTGYFHQFGIKDGCTSAIIELSTGKILNVPLDRICFESEIKKEKKEKFEEGSMAYRIANYLYRHILSHNPNFKKPNFREWANHADKMIRIDKRNPEEIKSVIEWCQRDDFWYKNILSTKKLRQKYDDLIIKMQDNKKPEIIKKYL